MRPSPPLEFPGGRYVAAWWKQLSPLRPRALWVGHLLLHHVEALARTSRPTRTDPLTGLLLRAVAGGETVANLEKQLCLERPFVSQLLHQLQADGLVTTSVNGHWDLSPLGRQALEQGVYARPGRERRAFHFLENEAGRAPQFLRLARPSGRPWPADENWTFDISLLRECVGQPAAWKRQHDFPEDVEGFPDTQDLPRGVPAWQAVAVDRPEYLPAVLVLAPGEQGERLCGFAVEPETWALNARETVFQVPEGWPEVFPDLASAPPPDVWRAAWLAWCQRRGLPTVEAEDCTVERQEVRVRVRAPGRLIERLRSSRSEALKGEAWLRAGAGRVRAAGLIEVASQ